MIVDFLWNILRPFRPRRICRSTDEISRGFISGLQLKGVSDQVHFIVDVVSYKKSWSAAQGVCLLSCRTYDGCPCPSSPASKHFHLPRILNPIIMIGPGTGVAPFNAHSQERKALGAQGRNWLFFGSQHGNATLPTARSSRPTKEEILTDSVRWSRVNANLCKP